MDISLVDLSINIGLLATGLGVGYKIGYTRSESKKVTTMTKPCSILFEHNKTTWKEPVVYYNGNKPFTNTCEALIKNKCSYTNKRCQLL